MLTLRPVDIDFEGFPNKKSGFSKKQFAIATENYTDTVSFQPPNSFNSLSSSEQRSHQWVSKFLHGLASESGDYPYFYMHQIFQSIVFRFPLSKFYSKGTEKIETLKKILEKKVVNLKEFFGQKLKI